MKGSKAKPDQRGSVPLLNFSTEPLGNGANPTSPLHEARSPQAQRKGVACDDKASPMEIGWRKHPQRECSHLDKANGKSLEGHRGCWCIFSLQPCLAPVSCIDIGQRVHQRPQFWLEHGGRRWSPYPHFLPLLHLQLGLLLEWLPNWSLWPVQVINYTPTFPHMFGDAMWVKSLSEISLNQRSSKSGSSWSDVHSFSGNSWSRDGSSTVSS